MTTIVTTAQTLALANTLADARLAHIARPTRRTAKALMVAEQAFRASRVADVDASVTVACAMIAA